MAKIYIDLTEEHLKLIRNLNVQMTDDESIVGIAKDNLYGGTYKYEQMALILGFTDKVVPGTEEDFKGSLYEKDVQLHMQDLDKYINENLLNIEEIMHQFSLSGGLKPGRYVTKDYTHIWSRVDSDQTENK